MRLTLRTLLAYLDDTLEPAQAKLIGQKVAESDAAQELIARIKQVTRRRRLTPPPTGPDSADEVNMIAEYLDNVLPVEQLAEMEEKCLSSDVYLAEVAACHQVLTLFLGEPALVPPTARQRMYGLTRGRESNARRKVAASPAGQGVETGNGAYGQEEETLLLGSPLYRRRGAWLRWVVPLAGACLFVAAMLALWMAIPHGSGSVSSGKDTSFPGPLAQAPEDRPEEPPKRPAEQPVPPQPEQKPEANSQPKSAPEDKAKTAEAQKAKTAEGQTDTEKKADAPKEPAQEPKPILVEAQPPSTDRRELGKVLLPAAGGASVLLHRAGEKGPWQRLKAQSAVESTDYLVSLPGYRSELRLASGVHLQLWGNLPQFSRIPVLESAVVLHVNPAVDLDFTLDHGRVVFVNGKGEGPAAVRLRFLNEIWDLTLQDKATEVGVELIGICRPYTKEPGGGEPDIHVRLYMLRGQADLKIRYKEYGLKAPCVFDWVNVFGVMEDSPKALETAPDWWTHKAPPQTPEAKVMEQALKALNNRLLAKDTIDVFLAEALRDREIGNRVLALRCLGAMSDMPYLLDALANEKYLDVRVVAIEELRHLLGLGTKNEEKLTQVLKQKNYSNAQAQTILQLLHGFSPQQWGDATTRATVVEYLNHDKLAIRQLTHALLMALVPGGDKIRYDPAGDSTQRERGYEEWKKLVTGAKPGAKP
jgi:hypothetical protein